MGTTVAVTGFGGLLGRPVAARLAERPEIDRVLGIDVADVNIPGVDAIRADIRDPAMAEHLAGSDIVVHLAFITDPMRDEEAMREVNVGGTRNVFEAAAAAGASKIVYASSAAAYGAHPDNDLPLVETSPLRANPDFSYGEQKLEIEHWVAEWEREHADVGVTILRPATVAGRGVENFITRLLESPKLIGVRDHHPPLQFVHVVDVAAAVEHVVINDLPGAYNVCSEGWLSFEESAELLGRTPVFLPEEVAFALTDRLWRLGVAEVPPGYLHYIMHPWVLTAEKLIATGWTPTRTNRESLAELVADHAGYVAVRRGVRVSKRNLRIGAGIAGAALAALAVRRILDDRD